MYKIYPIEFKTANVAAVLPNFLTSRKSARYSINLKTMRIMENLFEILTNEDKSFEFPWWVYAFVMPVALVVLMAIAGSVA
jgi:hypothetical protein